MESLIRSGSTWRDLLSHAVTVSVDEDSSSFGAVLVMKSTKDRDGDNIGRRKGGFGWCVATRGLLAEGLVWSRFVVPAAGLP